MSSFAGLAFMLIIPNSAHFLDDRFQMLALFLGTVSTLISLYELRVVWKEDRGAEKILNAESSKV